jgi:long-subunit fatty acid transport protein
MKLSQVAFTAIVCVSTGAGSVATAGGMFLPGSGSVSTARAGAAVASADDGEALGLNPAGIAKAKGTTITFGFAAIDYIMSFQRNGTYDQDDTQSDPYEGQRYPTITNDPSPPLGIGAFQPVPVIAIISDLGGAVPNLHVAAGLYAPNAYPFRNMNNVNGKPYFVPQDDGTYDFPAFGEAPPPTRYDIIEQEAAVILPSVAVAYSITPDLDIGGRLSVGWAEAKSTVALWGGLANFVEQVRADGLITLEAKDSFVMAYGFGATYRPTPTLEFGANFTGPVSMRAEGTAISSNGPGVSLNGTPVVIQPVQDEFARCNPGGTAEVLKGCVEFALPMTATVGGRYKFLDGSGKMRGDLELDLTYENWSMQRAGDYRVVVDAQVTTASMPDNAIDLKDSIIAHGFRDTFGARLGGSYVIPMGNNSLIARGGIAYDTAAAKEGWERADIDGAARTMIAAGASYALPRVRIDLGFGTIFEGTRESSRNCNPAVTSPASGCGPGGAVQPISDRQGPDPTNPLVVPEAQSESPVNQGTFKSHYLLFMLGATTWF